MLHFFIHQNGFGMSVWGFGPWWCLFPLRRNGTRWPVVFKAAKTHTRGGTKLNGTVSSAEITGWLRRTFRRPLPPFLKSEVDVLLMRPFMTDRMERKRFRLRRQQHSSLECRSLVARLQLSALLTVDTSSPPLPLDCSFAKKSLI